MEVIASGVYMMIVSGSVDDKLYVMGPTKGSIWHFDFLSIVVMVQNGSIEHTEPRWCGEVVSYHANVHLHFAWFRVGSRWRTGVDGYE